MSGNQDYPIPAEPLFIFKITDDFMITINLAGWVLIVVLACLTAFLIYQYCKAQTSFSDFELDSAEFGIGNGKLTFKPNQIDRQIAYAIWVELSTRKIGLEIDYEHDVISEVYNSWYTFFGVTRELIKDVPADKLQNESTREIVKLSVQILNVGIRPHLTRWQARFRKWYEKKLKDNNNDDDPQSIQILYPSYNELKADLEVINHQLIKYRSSMYLLATGHSENLLK